MRIVPRPTELLSWYISLVNHQAKYAQANADGGDQTFDTLVKDLSVTQIMNFCKTQVFASRLFQHEVAITMRGMQQQMLAIKLLMVLENLQIGSGQIPANLLHVDVAGKVATRQTERGNRKQDLLVY